MEDLKRRLAEKGLAAGSPIMLRVFKDEAELEVWVRKGERFELFSVYPICNWSGELGPKLTEGDRQSPEGLYSIGARQLHRTGRWRRSLDIGFPNTFDKAHGRTGSYILFHGGCTSTGCFAMTNGVMEEIFWLSEAALTQGQARIQVHVFPFRMTLKNLAAHADSPWTGFWIGLKGAYDLFEQTRIPPRVSVCNKQYVVGEVAEDADDDCVANVSEVSVATARLRNVRGAARARRARVARRTVQARHARAAGRNTRQAYAAARAARMAAHARRQASGLGGPGQARR
jgi:murein L,D-transpeptidase YafK